MPFLVTGPGMRSGGVASTRSRWSLELYDLADDANQMESRHRDPAYRSTKRQLLALWEEYLHCRGGGCRAPLAEELQADPAGQGWKTTLTWPCCFFWKFS